MSNDVLLLVTENLSEKLNKDIKSCPGRVFVLLRSLKADDTYTTVVQQQHDGFVYRLVIARATKLPNTLMEVTTSNHLWKEIVEHGLGSFTCNTSPIVLVNTVTENPLQVVKEIESIKSIIGFR